MYQYHFFAGNLFCSTIDKSYIAASYNFDLSVFLIVLQLNAELSDPRGYVKKFSALMQELVWNNDLNNFLVCLFAF